MEKKRLIVLIGFIVAFLIAIIISFMYYSDKYEVSFETGTSDIYLTRYVKKNETINEPLIPTKEGYVFKEWQLDGKKYNFDEGIYENMVLTAKWVKKEYLSVTYICDDEIIETKEVLKGEKIDYYPLVEKEDYEFIGWYLNHELYSDEAIYDNVTLVANFKNDKINTLYHIGDEVKIIGTYSNSAYDKDKDYYKAIGWNRVILYIIEDGEYPYAVGLNGVVTGFFKSSSIEKIS